MICGVKEALSELQLSKEVFYRLRRLREVPKVKGTQRFLTSRQSLWSWFNGLCDPEEE